ncbi:histidine utilization repressor [Cupriavidus sp. AcVe19-6a]|uniref:histidine utilization repressor n=1 Tax=Cupriavidus sp. AcVe19-6a TaxID=2821358 RepID=UPI001AE3A55A|nr:histidine utilization repressor [Cupriavidus sp. AcVe19-6a]MBP0635872.1 histidine utilization repressor [Cupriavidus sp. AcVe19-6a]
MPLASTPAPLYARVKQHISSRIADGSWPPHHRVPSEAELVEALGVSRMTVHRALRELTAEGMLVRLQGVGTFVAEPKLRTALYAVNNIANDIAARGHRHHARVVSVQEERAGAAQAVALDVPLEQRVFHSVIVHYEDDVAIQLEDRYVNALVAPDYLEQDFSRETPYQYLTRVAPLTEGEHVVEAVLAHPEECALLDIDKGEPCLLIRRRTWSAGRVVTSVRLVHPGSLHRLEGRFTS